LRRTPGFSATVIAVAALGIGATTAAFSLADHVLFRPLPFPESHRLVRVWEELSKRGYARVEPSPPNFQDWQRQSTKFERLEAFTGFGGAMTGRGEAARIAGATVTPGMLPMLGRHAAIGRVLTEADVARSRTADRDQRPTVAIGIRGQPGRRGPDTYARSHQLQHHRRHAAGFLFPGT
jgi:putative ABC transport system permease protein